MAVMVAMAARGSLVLHLGRAVVMEVTAEPVVMHSVDSQGPVVMAVTEASVQTEPTGPMPVPSSVPPKAVKQAVMGAMAVQVVLVDWHHRAELMAALASAEMPGRAEMAALEAATR